MIAQLNKRFEQLEKAIWQLVVVEDAFGLTHDPTFFLNARFVFDTDDRKIAAFREWLKEQLATGLLEVEQQFTTRPWLAEFVFSAYKQGVVRSFVQLNPDTLTSAGFVAGSRAQFLADAFNAPETINRLQLLYTRSFEALKGVTEQMGSEMSRVLTDALAHGRGARTTAVALRKATGTARARSRTIARTELVHAQAEGQLDALERLGEREVTILAEILTAGDDLVCPICKRAEKRTQKRPIPINKARGMIPLHPNCRCAFAPVVATSTLRSRRDRLRSSQRRVGRMRRRARR